MKVKIAKSKSMCHALPDRSFIFIFASSNQNSIIMKKNFVRLTTNSGEKLLVNLSNVAFVKEHGMGCTVYYCVRDDESPTGFKGFDVKENPFALREG